MKNVTKITVEIEFPLGAHFYKNINELVYKQLTAFIHNLSCIAIDKKCKECPLRENCNYYKFTGENFTHYPGLIIENDIFTKTIYQKREIAKFTFYCIGEAKYLKEYIRIFFEDHLHQQLCSHFYYLKEIKDCSIEDAYASTSTLTSFNRDNKDPLSAYIKMLAYYNQYYKTSFEIPNSENKITNTFSKKVSLPDIRLKTRTIHRVGLITTCKYETDITVYELFEKIKVGKVSFLGGM